MEQLLYGLVLAGGKSSRMGHDKAMLCYHGERQLQRAVTLLTSCVEKVFVSLREDQRSDPVRTAFPYIVDQDTVQGPAAGLLAAYRQFPHVSWLVVACDLPFVKKETLQSLYDYWRKHHGERAVAYRSAYDGLPEPLCTIWTPSVLASLQRRVNDGAMCPRRALIDSHVPVLDMVDSHQLDNINTPAERQCALERLEGDIL